MPVQQERGVLDEYAVWVIREVGQADDLEAGAAKCVLIGRVLLDSFGDVERHALQVREFAIGKAGANGPCEGSEHGAALESKRAARKLRTALRVTFDKSD
jgi:hypothetical protein